MTNNLHPKTSLWARLIIVPVVAGLISASIIIGYASNDFATRRSSSSTANAMHRIAWGAPNSTQNSNDDPTPGASDPSNDPLANYKLTLELLRKHYYGTQIDSKKTEQLTYEGIRGLLGSLRDLFTSFLDPDEWSQMKATTQGDFEGIGALLQQDPNTLIVKIVRPIETSPAEKAGVKADDVIVSVDGKSVKGKNINDVVRLIKGPRGTKVVVGMRRGKTDLSFTITRARVEPPIVRAWMEDDKYKIGHIVLSEFNEKSMKQLSRAFDTLQSQGMRALVFDLRFNPGGLLDTAIDVTSLFVPQHQNKTLKDVVVWIKEGTGQEQRRTLHDVDRMFRRNLPLVVLINENSASASEIVSGAIKDYGVGTLIGERTFGKGRVQTLYPLDDGSALRLTTALYFTPKHTDINFKRDEDGVKVNGTGGIVPDIEVKQPEKWKRSEDFKDKANDKQLQKALEFLRVRLDGKTVVQAIQTVQKAR